MKRFRIFLIILCVLFFQNACNKPGDTSQDSGYLYYDYYSDSTTIFPPYTNNAKLNSKRVCYDITNDKVVWEIKNEFPMPPKYAYYNRNNFSVNFDDHTFSKAFLAGNYIIKIFSSADFPSEGGPSNGVYFQKINKQSGAAEISKKIIQPSEYNSSDQFVITSVVSDGSNYFFGCNNGYVYSYNAKGDQLWKKGAYSFVNILRTSLNNLGGGYVYIFFDENKIYFSALNNTNMSQEVLYCLNSTNGEMVWKTVPMSSRATKYLFFNATRVFFFYPEGDITILDKANGQILANSSANQRPLQGVAKPIGPANNEFVTYFSKAKNIEHVELARPQLATITFLSNLAMDEKFILNQGLIYGGRNFGPPFGNFVFSCIDPFNGEVWRKEFSPPQPLNYQTYVYLYDYKIVGDKIYLLTDFHIEGVKCVFNEIRRVTLALYGQPVETPSPGLIVLDKNTGAVIEQIQKLPVGVHLNILYNFAIE